jgi:hypothetical protein
MVKYFSDFLNDVGEMVRSLKTYAYELANLPTPQPRLDHVYHSMSSIILSTHRTFQDLTRIRAVLATLTSARHSSRPPASPALSHASTSCRSRSDEEIFFSPRKRKT